MSLQCGLGIAHHGHGEVLGQLLVEAPLLVELGELAGLDVRVPTQLDALEVELVLEQLGLGLHGAVLAGGHGDRAGDPAGEPGEADHTGPRAGAGDAEDQRDVGHQAVAGPEHRGAGHAALDVAVLVLGDRDVGAGRGEGGLEVLDRVRPGGSGRRPLVRPVVARHGVTLPATPGPP